MVASGKAAAAATGQTTTQSKPCKGDRYSARPYRTPTNLNSVPVAAHSSESLPLATIFRRWRGSSNHSSVTSLKS